MKRVLIVAYYFPPRGGAGTQRFAKFCRYLPEHGFAPIVLTSGDVTSAHAPHDDPTLVDDAVSVIERVDAPRRPRFRRRVMNAMRFRLDEDAWVDEAEERAVELARRERAEVVVTTLSPFACYRIGLRLQRDLRLPWVLDLRDPWSLDGWRGYPSGLHARADLVHMRRALRSADFVIANVPEAAKEFVAMGAAAGRTVVIPNGFDVADFDGEHARVLPDDGHFHLVHMGTFHDVDAPEGLTSNRFRAKRHRQIAPLGRSGFYLLHAIAQLRERSPAAFARLRVHLFGNVDSSHRALIDRLGIADRLLLHGYRPHAESIAALCQSDAVFVPLHGVPDGERALVVPGKLYEALASERPVLAALPPGDGADLVRALDAGLVVSPTSAVDVCAALQRLLEEEAGNSPIRGCRREPLRVFTRTHLTGLLAQVLEAAMAGRGSVVVENPWQTLAVTGSALRSPQESA